MQKWNEHGVATMKAGGSFAEGDLVKFSTGRVVKTTGATDVAIGVALDSATADGEEVPIKVLGSGGTVQLKAGGAITQGAQITANATATSADTDVIIGVALAAATASGDMIEIAHQVAQKK